MIKIVVIFLVVLVSFPLYGFGRFKIDGYFGVGGVSGEMFDIEKKIASSIYVIFTDGTKKQLKVDHSLVTTGPKIEYMIDPYIGIGLEYSYNEIIQRSDFEIGYQNESGTYMALHNLLLNLNCHFFKGRKDLYISLIGGYGTGKMEAIVVAKKIPGIDQFDTTAHISSLNYGLATGYAYRLRSYNIEFVKNLFFM